MTSEIMWHEYPDDAPLRTDTFLITYYTGKLNLARFETGKSCRGQFTKHDKAIVAWSELPEPYEVTEEE